MSTSHTGAPPPPEYQAAARHTVRDPLTRIVGRDGLIASLEALLDRGDTRLVTLTGPGGIGKTRLSLEVASRVQRDFAHGACFVSLDSVRDPEAVPAAVAEALGLRERGGQPLPEAITTTLRAQHLLLVLDNFEQVTPASLWVAELLTACPRVKALVTSRARLRIQGERHMSVPPLPVANGDLRRLDDVLEHSPAMALFVERARALRPDFALTDANAVAIRDICQQLDGLPLAIELAAAKVTVLSPYAILARLSDRLALLTGNLRDAPPRLQTMRNAIAWSYDLLQPEEKQLFRRLSIFAGTFSLADAVAVGLEPEVARGEPRGGMPDLAELQEVASLLDQSLIQYVSSDHGESRFRMLTMIREFGLEQLKASSEADRIARRHARHVLALVERSGSELTGPDQVRWLNHLASIHDDIRAAVAWLQQQGEHELQLRLAVALWPYAYIRGYLTEMRKWLDAAIETNPEPMAMRAEALNASGVLASVQGDILTAVARHNAALELSEMLGDQRGLAMALNGLGNAAEVEGDHALAFERYGEARDRFREIGDRRSVGVMLINLGNLYWMDGDLDKAIAYQQEAGDLFREVGSQRGVAWSATNLGSIAFEQGDLTGATKRLLEAIGLYRELGDQSGIIETLERFADIAGARGQRERQATLLDAAAGIRQAINIPVQAINRERYDATIADLREHLGETYDSIWKAGQKLSIDEVLAIVSASESFEQPVATLPRDAAAEAHGLTQRELEVLRLMADGMTNQEIADTLYLSPRTVTSHASNILGKLGTNTRTAAVAYAIRNDLA
ncbi:MAG TPA: tetratricopeptide repeat protein [Thermomicrobiales bacterium]|nr:tetratricopeptide repeat protein [Thermomicrobiales bacterium]